ncbi:MAG: hypothetical protein QY320_11900 [Gammaproteobacteria bacterium]|nr:MAG: hypothetical protein QY320_11900 [Gammaproteobacteria bacterium]
MTAPARFTGELFLEDLAGLERTGFVVCSFFTPGDGYERYARRLAASCRRFGLPHSLWRVPVVHHSISWRGSPDLRFTKAGFIEACLDRLGGPGVAYLDVDMLVAAQPQSLCEAQAAGHDFAVYNWFGDPRNEAYLPANHQLASTAPESSFYLFSHRVEWCSHSQLNCSGSTQFYRNSPAARALLARWQQTIAANPRAADDQSLNFAYNNPIPGTPPPRALWLDKAYMRCPWWPHVAPVILHPQIPALSQPFAAVAESAGGRLVHFEHCTRNETPLLFPRDGGVDTATGIVFRLDAQGRPQPVGRYEGRFWIYGEDPTPEDVH